MPVVIAPRPCLTRAELTAVSSELSLTSPTTDVPSDEMWCLLNHLRSGETATGAQLWPSGSFVRHTRMGAERHKLRLTDHESAAHPDHCGVPCSLFGSTARAGYRERRRGSTA